MRNTYKSRFFKYPFIDTKIYFWKKSCVLKWRIRSVSAKQEILFKSRSKQTDASMLSLKPSMKNLDTSAEIDPDTCYFKLAKKRANSRRLFITGSSPLWPWIAFSVFRSSPSSCGAQCNHCGRTGGKTGTRNPLRILVPCAQRRTGRIVPRHAAPSPRWGAASSPH